MAGGRLGNFSLWLEAVIAASIILAGPMAFGYAVFDELALLIIASLFLVARTKGGVTQPIGGLEALHWLVYCLFLIYLVVSCLRGIDLLADWRISRFALMFVALGVVAYIRYSSAPSDSASIRKMTELIAWAGVIYFVAYLSAGVIAEWVFGADRFSLQGHFWSGTSTAVFPAFVMGPALFLLVQDGRIAARRLFWIGYCILITVSFYYQSRSVWLLLIGLLIGGIHMLGLRRTAVASGIFVVFVLVFPWDRMGPLTPENLRDVSDFSDNRTSIICRKLGRFTGALVGSISPDIEKKVFGCEQNEHRSINGTLVIPGSAIWPMLSGSDYQADADRKIAVIAAIRYTTEQNVLPLLFGSGYYTHRYLLIPYFQLVAKQHEYVFPDVYKQIVRTATLVGMLVDTGLVGIALLLALFVLTSARLWSVGGNRSLPSLVGLGLIFISQFVSLNFDVILLYLTLMPGGALLGLFPRVQEDFPPRRE